MASGTAAVAQHQHSFFEGHQIEERHWAAGRIAQRIPGFYVHQAGPGPRSPGWTYCTVGVWASTHNQSGHGLEFVMSSPRRDDRIVELLTIAAFYHAGPQSQRLDVGHTVPIGEPWLDGSECDHLLVSVPYPYGPALEVCDWKEGHARHLWLLPVTEAERDFKTRHGLEALERQLEEAGALPTDTARPSVV